MAVIAFGIKVDYTGAVVVALTTDVFVAIVVVCVVVEVIFTVALFSWTVVVAKAV